MVENKIYLPAGMIASIYSVLDKDNKTQMLPYHDLFYFMLLFERHFMKTESGKTLGFVPSFYTMPHWPDVEGNEDNYNDFFQHQAWLRKYASRFADSFEEIQDNTKKKDVAKKSDCFDLYLKITSAELKANRTAGGEKYSRYCKVFSRLNELIKNYGAFFYRPQVEASPRMSLDVLGNYTRANMYVFNHSPLEDKQEELAETLAYFREYMESERCKILHNRNERDFNFAYSDRDLLTAFESAMSDFKAGKYLDLSQCEFEKVRDVIVSDPFFSTD